MSRIGVSAYGYLGPIVRHARDTTVPSVGRAGNGACRDHRRIDGVAGRASLRIDRDSAENPETEGVYPCDT